MNNFQKVFFLLGIGVFVLCFKSISSWAQPSVELDLTRETYPEVMMAIPKFVPADKNSKFAEVDTQARKILENDLRLSELFQLVDQASYGWLASREIDEPKINYQAWRDLNVQWVIKSKFKLLANGKEVIFVFRLYDAQNERFLVGKRYRAKLEFLRRIIHRFADEVVAHLTGKPGLAGTRIAFSSGKSGQKEVYIIDFDGHNIKKLTNDLSLDISPAWGPSGQRIVFTSYVNNNPDMVMVDLSRKKRWVVLKLPGLNAAPAWSPDGSNIALVLSKDGNSEIYILNKNSKLRRLTNDYNIDTSPTWSPDAKKIAFTSDRSGTAEPQIFIMNATGDGGKAKRISFGSSYNDNPAWSPNGDEIAYASRVNRKFQIKIYNVETGETRTLTSGSGNKEEPSWSPDGRFLVYRQTGRGNAKIYVKRVGSKKERSLVNLPTGAHNPAWSPYLK